MTLYDRIEIQICISKGMTFKAIAAHIGKSPTTVSREVKRNSQPHTNGYTRTEEDCPQLMKAPFVCNACSKRSRSSCPYVRRIYIANPPTEVIQSPRLLEKR